MSLKLELNKAVKGKNYFFKLVQNENGTIDQHCYNILDGVHDGDADRVIFDIDINKPLPDGTYLPKDEKYFEYGVKYGKFKDNDGFQPDPNKSELENMLDLINQTNDTNLKVGQVKLSFPEALPGYEFPNPEYDFGQTSSDEWKSRPVYNDKNTFVMVTGLAGSGFEGKQIRFEYRRQVINPIFNEAFGNVYSSNPNDKRIHLVDFPVNNFDVLMQWVKHYLPIVFCQQDHEKIGWFPDYELESERAYWDRFTGRPRQHLSTTFNLRVQFEYIRPNGLNYAIITAENSFLYTGQACIGIANSIDSFAELLCPPYHDYWHMGLTAEEYNYYNKNGRYPDSWINRWRDKLNGVDPNKVLADEEAANAARRNEFEGGPEFE